MKIQVRETHLLTTDLETELWKVENGQQRYISDAAAVTIAGWFQSSVLAGVAGRVLGAFAAGRAVDHCELLADIGHAEGNRDVRELRHLVTWVTKTQMSGGVEQAGRIETESTWAAAERAHGEREKQIRASLDADANGRAAGHHAARTAGPDSAAVRDQLAEEHGNGGYPDGPLAADYRAGFAFGWATWASHRDTQSAPEPEPFQPHDPAALAACLKSYDALQPDRAKLAAMAEAIDGDDDRQERYEEELSWYETEARVLLDEFVTALRGQTKAQRVHYAELSAGDIVTEHDTEFRVIARGEELRGRRVVQWVSTEAVTEPSDQLRPFVTEIGGSHRLQSREDLAYVYRIAPETKLDL
ncbi:hypothetical protein GCM10009789_83270 [Kribbella sancticallisti]|uniref:Uncharacterized protein n=1 Tax=Kribbella sancticallisti TaxID=460087 RepID=A0ABP4QSR3_9ACTN